MGVRVVFANVPVPIQGVSPGGIWRRGDRVGSKHKTNLGVSGGVSSQMHVRVHSLHCARRVVHVHSGEDTIWRNHHRLP